MIVTPRLIFTATVVAGIVVLLLVTGMFSVSTPIENIPPESPNQIDTLIQIDRTGTATVATVINLSLTRDSEFGAYSMLMPSSLLRISPTQTASWISPFAPLDLSSSAYELRYEDKTLTELKPLSAQVPEGLFVTLPWDKEATMPAGKYIFTLQTETKGLIQRLNSGEGPTAMPTTRDSVVWAPIYHASGPVSEASVTLSLPRSVPPPSVFPFAALGTKDDAAPLTWYQLPFPSKNEESVNGPFALSLHEFGQLKVRSHEPLPKGATMYVRFEWPAELLGVTEQ